MTLVPKEPNAVSMDRFRPLAMINCSFKIFAKCATNKFGPVCNDLISPNQTAFIKGRFIMESIVSAHEIVHSVASNKLPGFVFKLDYEKAYDMISREFLLRTLRMRGFGPKWMYKLESLLHRGSVGVRINDTNSDFFIADKGVRQGDPVSPLLFNLVADVFTRMLKKAANNNLIAGVFPPSNPAGVISMQYADDTLLFLDDNINHARNLKWLLSCFEHLSGMRINFHKCDLVPINIDRDVATGFAQTLGCKLSSFPIKYLGAPLHHNKIRREDLQPMVDKIINRAAGWRGRLLSFGKRLVLVQACLASIPSYLMGFIKFPKWAINLINSQLAHCFWDDYEGHHKYHLSSWGSLTMRKEYGGFGITDLADMNLCLLASWVSRYYTDNGKIWKNIIDAKYNTQDPNLFACSSTGASPFWKGVLWAAKASKVGFSWNIGNGKKARFWEDHWFGSAPLATQYWELYNLAN